MAYPDGGPYQAMRTRRPHALSPPIGRWIAGSFAVGAVLTILAATASGSRFDQATTMVVLAVLGAALVALVGSLIGRRMRTRSLAVQVAVIVLLELGATLIGVFVATRAMAIPNRDLWAMAVVVLAAGTALVVAALVLADRLGRASAALADLAADLAGADDQEVTAPRGLPAELAEVADQLTETWAQLRDARAREQVVDGSRRELVAWVSHDLRLPLLGLSSLIEALEDGMVTDPATITRYHQSIGRDAERLSQLVDDLHDLNRVQVGSLQAPPERIEITGLVSDGVAAVSLAAEARGVAVRGELDQTDHHVVGSAPDLSLVVANLLDVAIRHTHRGGEVTVAAAADDGEVAVTVQSNAGQLPVADDDPGFDLAFGTSGEPAAGPGPVGLEVAPVGPGLTVARKLVDAHCGELVVTNDLDGCRLRLRLPLGP
ncbi:HAMP domain-containing sensor histidine kinase [soil metagenome]